MRTLLVTMSCPPIGSEMAARFGIIAALCLQSAAVLAESDPVVPFDSRICGPVALACALDDLNVGVPLESLLGESPRGGADSSFEELGSLVKKYGLESIALEWNRLPRIDEHTTPAVILIRGPRGERHFIALLAARDGNVKIQNFPDLPTWMPEQAVRSQLGWNGIALHVARNQAALSKIMPSSTTSDVVATLIVVIILATTGCVIVRQRKDMAVNRLSEGRAGYTIMDLVVALAIVSLLMSLLLPAIERSREAARKLSCQSNQKQICLAVANFAEAQNRLPNVDTLPLTMLPGGLPTSSDISIQALLLPYLDQMPLFQQIRFDEYRLGYSATGITSELNSALLKTSVPVFQCPSDSIPAGGCSFAFSCGTSPGLHGNYDVPIEEAASTGYVGHLMNQHARFTDGLSQTAVLSERLVGDRNLARYSPVRDHAYLPAFNGFSAGTAATSCATATNPPTGHFSYEGTCWLARGHGYTWYNHILTPNSRIPDCSDSRVLGGNTLGCHTARSAHFGGVNAGLGDGSVRFISSDIDTRVWRALGTSQGNEIMTAGGPP